MLNRCEWCGQEVNKLVQVKLNGVTFKICPHCIESFKAHKCVKCGAPIENSKFYKGMCVQCAQIDSIIEERKQQDLENALPEDLQGLGNPNPMTEKGFEDFLNGVGFSK